MTRLSRGVAGMAVAVLALVSTLETGGFIGQAALRGGDRYGGDCDLEVGPAGPMPRGAWEHCIRSHPPLPGPPPAPSVAPPAVRPGSAVPPEAAAAGAGAAAAGALPPPRGWTPPLPPPAGAAGARPASEAELGAWKNSARPPAWRSPFPAAVPLRTPAPCAGKEEHPMRAEAPREDGEREAGERGGSRSGAPAPSGLG